MRVVRIEMKPWTRECCERGCWLYKFGYPVCKEEWVKRFGKYRYAKVCMLQMEEEK